MELALGWAALPRPGWRWWRLAATLVAAVVLLFAIAVTDGFV